MFPSDFFWGCRPRTIMSSEHFVQINLLDKLWTCWTGGQGLCLVVCGKYGGVMLGMFGGNFRVLLGEIWGLFGGLLVTY